MDNTGKKCGAVAILGRPNVGKSTLLNALVGGKISIVTPKPQTTRGNIQGILTKGDVQIVFTDTPGLHKSRSRLGDRMNRAVYDSADGADAAILMGLSDKLPGIPEEYLASRLFKAEIPCVVALNKTDTARKDIILETIGAYAKLGDFRAIIPISARTGQGLDDLLSQIPALLPEGEHFFPEDEQTDQSSRALAAEFVREKLMLATEMEIPHGIACVTERFHARPDGVIEIDVLIVCDKPNHKNIIIGKQGSLLKSAGTQARMELEELLGEKVFLTLWVKVKNDWRNSETFLTEISEERQ